MANFIANANLGPEYLESNLKSILASALNFTGTLTSGSIANVAIVGGDGLTYGTFVLDALNVPVRSGLITNLHPQLKFVVLSGNGQFNITLSAG